MESKWYDYVMVEADSHLKLLHTFILDIYTVSEHIDMMSIGIQQQPYTVYPPYLAQMLGFWVTCGVKMIALCHGCGWQPPQTAPHIHIKKTTVFEHIDMLSIGIQQEPYTYTYPIWLRCWGCGHLLSQIMSLWNGWYWQQSQTLPASILDIYAVFELIDMLSIGIW